jgi:two-component system alkaline phosphatase synthesis response regulator PhoP
MDILIVDDEAYIQRSLSFVFKKEGYEVDIASDGEEGLEKAFELKPRIIFLDVMMPKLNGFNACKKIKSDEALKDTYVIMLTGKGQEIDREKGLREGADEFISKPFSPKEIVAKVKGILGDPS